MGRQKRNYQAVTIKDVAKEAGVSVSTVSRVLNNLDRVSEKTRMRVNDAVHKLSYVPNNLAVSMVTGQTRIVMIVVPDLIHDFFRYVIQYAEQVFREHGYLPMVFSSGEDPDADPISYLNRFSHMIEGALVIPTRDRIGDLLRFQKPIVIVDRTIADIELNSVMMDNFGGCYQLTQLLLEKNHKKIAFIGSDTDMNIGKDRLLGFRQAMLNAGLSPQERYIRRGSMRRETGSSCTEALLALEEPPTAIIAGSEEICIGCMQTIMGSGLTIGKNISLVSFDDPLAYLVPPSITSAFTPRHLLGQYAAERLLEMITNSDDRRIIQKTVEVEIIQRDSVAQL